MGPFPSSPSSQWRLCQVVLLVGLILLPNRFQIRGTSMYHHCRGEPVDVATVLVFLSPDLASQIANRKAFYKE